MEKLAVSLLGLVLLTGCTATSNEYSDTYRSVEELKEAFELAGGDCPNWEQSNHVKLAAESGTCSTSNVLSIYTSAEVKEEQIKLFKSLPAMGSTLLVGENWIINDHQVEDLDPAIGGTFLTF